MQKTKLNKIIIIKKKIKKKNNNNKSKESLCFWREESAAPAPRPGRGPGGGTTKRGGGAGGHRRRPPPLLSSSPLCSGGRGRRVGSGGRGRGGSAGWAAGHRLRLRAPRRSCQKVCVRPALPNTHRRHPARKTPPASEQTGRKTEKKKKERKTKKSKKKKNKPKTTNQTLRGRPRVPAAPGRGLGAADPTGLVAASLPWARRGPVLSVRPSGWPSVRLSVRLSCCGAGGGGRQSGKQSRGVLRRSGF